MSRIKRMRIAIITGEFPAISETFVINHVIALLDLGHEVTVFAFTSNESASPHNVVQARGLELLMQPLDPYIGNSTMTRLLNRIALLASNGWREPRLAIRALDPRIGGRKALNLSLYTFAHAFEQHDEFDIVHCHFGWTGILGAMLKKATAFDSKLVVTFHGADVNVATAMGSARQRKLMFDMGDCFTANTNFTKSQAISIGCPAERCSIWHMGVDTRLFDFHERLIADDEPVRIVTVGRLIEKKGIEYVIRALPHLANRGRRIEYHIVGDGPLRAYLEQLASELSLSNRIVFHGRCTSIDVRNHLDQAHIFALTSVTAQNYDREGQGVALIEAQASGLPVIATYHNGFPEAVRNNQSGFLVPERDPEALAERLNFLIANPGKWGEMGRAGRQFVEQEFALDRCTSVLSSIYEQVLGN